MRKLGRWWASLSLGGQLLVGALAAVVLWLLWATVLIRLVLRLWTSSWSPTNETNNVVAQLGQIGDLFGGVNALFAAFAFVGVAIAAFYQHQTFRLQAEQNVRHAFEPLFFKLLDSHRPPDTLVAEAEDSMQPWKPAAFSECMSDMRETLEAHIVHRAKKLSLGASIVTSPDLMDRDQKHTWEWARRIYGPFYTTNDGELAPYFRKLYQLFKLISESDLAWPAKVRYANIARASLNKDELLLLALNCATVEGAEFKPLVEGFGLLKHIPRKRSLESIEAILAGHLCGSTATMSSEQREIWWHRFPDERPTWAKAPQST